MEMNPGLKNISKFFSGLRIFSDFSIEFSHHHINCILGPSGCGKTTLLQIISGLVSPDQGDLNGFLGMTFSYIFQENRLLPWKTVRGNIEFVLKNQFEQKEASAIAGKYIHLVELDGYENFFPSQLSGGMKQRVSIARAFSFPSGIILLDEPFKGLDVSLKRSLMNSIYKIWNEDKRTMIYVTHDIDEALFFGQRIFVFSNKPVNILGEFTQSEVEIGNTVNGYRKVELRNKIQELLGL